MRCPILAHAQCDRGLRGSCMAVTFEFQQWKSHARTSPLNTPPMGAYHCSRRTRFIPAVPFFSFRVRQISKDIVNSSTKSMLLIKFYPWDLLERTDCANVGEGALIRISSPSSLAFSGRNQNMNYVLCGANKGKLTEVQTKSERNRITYITR